MPQTLVNTVYFGRLPFSVFCSPRSVAGMGVWGKGPALVGGLQVWLL